MKKLFNILMAICAVIGVYFMIMAAIESNSRERDDRLHIAQLKGLLPFGKLSRRREAYDGEEVVARKIADYRDEDDDDYLDDESVISAVTARLPRKVKQADPIGKKRISRLRKAAEAAEEELAENIGDASEAVSDLSEDKLEELLDN